MLTILFHLYDFAEAYVVILSWLVIPLFFLAIYQFFSSHYGLFGVGETSANSHLSLGTTPAISDVTEVDDNSNRPTARIEAQFIEEEAARSAAEVASGQN